MSSFRTLQLTEKQATDLDRYWAKVGRENARDGMLAKNYIEEFLVLQKREEGRSGNCYSSGTHYYTRKDGLEITSDDVEAVENDWLGQENKVTCPDPLTIKRYWACDSGD